MTCPSGICPPPVPPPPTVIVATPYQPRDTDTTGLSPSVQKFLQQLEDMPELTVSATSPSVAAHTRRHSSIRSRLHHARARRKMSRRRPSGPTVHHTRISSMPRRAAHRVRLASKSFGARLRYGLHRERLIVS